MHICINNERTASYGAAFFSDDDDDDDDDVDDDDDEVDFDNVGKIFSKKVFFGDVVHLWRHERSKLGGLGVINKSSDGTFGFKFLDRFSSLVIEMFTFAISAHSAWFAPICTA